MKKMIAIALLASLALAGCFPKEGSAPNSDAQAYCKTTYSTEDMCVTDARCEWKLRSDGKEVCRAK